MSSLTAHRCAILCHIAAACSLAVPSSRGRQLTVLTMEDVRLGVRQPRQVNVRPSCLNCLRSSLLMSRHGLPASASHSTHTGETCR